MHGGHCLLITFAIHGYVFFWLLNIAIDRWRLRINSCSFLEWLEFWGLVVDFCLESENWGTGALQRLDGSSVIDRLTLALIYLAFLLLCRLFRSHNVRSICFLHLHLRMGGCIGLRIFHSWNDILLRIVVLFYFEVTLHVVLLTLEIFLSWLFYRHLG